jgi:hypothetical protein
MLMLLYGGDSYYQAVAYGYQFCNLTNALNNAPCDGPFNHCQGDAEPDGWASDRRFVDTWNDQTGSGNPGNFADWIICYCSIFKI